MVVESPQNGSLAGAAESKARKWRGKLFKDKTPKASIDEQVDDFLGSHRSPLQSSRPSISSSASAPQLPAKPPQQSYRHDQQQHHHHHQLRQQPEQRRSPSYHSLHHPHQKSPTGTPVAPRLNLAVSQRWPEAGDISSRSPSRPSIDAKTATGATPISTQGKRRRNKGLKVTFSNDGPEVIGEGGEEAELPTKDVLLYRSRSHSSASNAAAGSHSQFENADPYGSPSDSTHWPGAYPGQGYPAEDPREKLKMIKSAHELDFLLSLEPHGAGGARLSLRDSGDPNSFAHRVRARMRVEEGLALQKATRTDSPTDPDELDSQPSQETVLPLRPSATSKLSLDMPQEPAAAAKYDFWGSVLSALPNKTKSNWQDTNVSNSPVNTHNSPGSYPETPPPPYLKSSRTEPDCEPEKGRPSLESSFNNDPHPTENHSPWKKSWRAAANAVSNDALADFTARAAQYNDIFSDAAESVKPSMETSLSEWIRASVWWFLKGRSDVEASMRPQPSNGGGNSPSDADRTCQGVLNLAKTWWITEHIVPGHPELSRFGNMSLDTLIAVTTTAGDQRLSSLMSVRHATLSHLRALAISMKRNNILPAAMEHVHLSRGIDTTIWVRYPFFAPDISAVLSGQVTRSMLMDTARKTTDIGDVMPLGDSSRYFCYGRMFVEAYLSSSEDDSQQFAIPCVLSIIRDRGDWNVLVSITSQNELVNVMIQGDKKHGPTWADVDWQVRTNSMRIRLPRGFELDIQFDQADFKMIWKIVEYTHKTEESLQPEAGETLLFEDVLKVFQYMDSGPNKAFPAEPSPRCRIRLFEKAVTLTEGTGTRKAHRGFRFVAVTSPKVKTLSSVSHELGNGTPIVFGYLRGEDGAPALLIKIPQEGSGRNRSMLLTFHEQEERAKLHSLLLGITPLQDEVKTPDLPMRAFSMEQLPDGNGISKPIVHLQFSSPSATVINNGGPSLQSTHGYSSTVLSEHLRVFVTSNWGSATDRINIGPGELKIALDVTIPTIMSILRPPQLDLGISVADNLVPKETVGDMTNLLKLAQTSSVVRRYNFSSVQDLHRFQKAITNFKVLFDGFASLFTISRRRMVVPIYKKWEASRVRLQVLRQEKIVQLAAFFHDDFSHGKCMNFVLKSTDIFESFNHRSGKFGVKIVDAKFALPKQPADDPTAGFVCLDMPEYPGEHDDITVVFDSEKDRVEFQNVMPGSVKEPSRVGSLRK
ncbi:conserved hypothetical protein [Histoplasma capsulatum G186AR]|uniref:Uncharacterized protein n=2 Tax=Ajellomyces capsulatus TaxID=5037 RepID=C0NB76_AJECG|nr:uncharacterized protein HCBG_00372 [Histoplasma capsulatum G186AR]EEH10917.1 conserved hypothetical protein [Histoplasma capsulatum G186AR]KAG5288789.1 hypothetical protein I7I52_12384 [Histoplasma capsulatum]QSS71366.1 hypothetical protein I7I50_02170 [Histoplasma capsulatum G186AR]